MRAQRLAMATILIGLAPVGVAAAADVGVAPVTLSWDAPAACSDAKTIEAEVQRLLGTTTVAAEKHVVARAKVAPVGRGAVRVSLTTDRGGVHGVRTVDAASCRAAAESTALILALTIDPAQVAARGVASGTGAAAAPIVTGAPAGSPSSAAPSSAPASTAPSSAPASTAPSGAPTEPPGASGQPSATSSAPAPEAAAPPGPAERPAPAKRVRPAGDPPTSSAANAATTRIAIAAFGAADVGSLPKAALGLGGAIAWTPGRARIEVGATSFPASTASARGSRGGDFQLSIGQLRACYGVLPPGIFSLSPCAVGDAGSMSASGFGVNSPSSGAALFAAAGPGVLAALRLGDAFALRLTADLELVFTRAQFVLDAVGAVHQPSIFAGRTGLGGEIRF